MALLHPPASASPTLKVLHLVGARSDQGGILSVLRALQSAATAPSPAGPGPASVKSVVWVHDSFVDRRPPPLDLRRNPAALDEAPSHLRLLLTALRAWPGLRRLLANEPFDVVHGHSRGAFPLTVWLAQRRRVGLRSPAVLFTNHTYAQRTGMYRTAVRRAGLPMVLLTPNMARHYDLTGAPGVTLLSACAHDRFFAEPLTTRPENSGTPLRFVGVGNLVRWKNWHLLLEAWGQLPEPLRAAGRLDLWGPTLDDEAGQRYAAELRARIEQLRLADTVSLRGPTNAIVETVTAADWFVLPSTNEPCSVALIEALALGRPALVSASGGNIDIVKPGINGCHFRPDDVADLTRQLTAILRREIAPASPSAIRNSVRERAAATVATGYAELYQHLLGRTDPGSTGATRH